MNANAAQQKPNSPQPKTKSATPLCLAILTASTLLASGCSVLFPPPSITVLGDGRQNWYPPGQSVSIPAAVNTNGLWVLTPSMLEHMVLRSADR